MKTAIHKTINTILRPFKLQITRINQVSQSSTSEPILTPLKTNLKQWKRERQYWGSLLQDFYKNEYDLALHTIQTDDLVVPPQSLVNEIQSAHMAIPDGFFGSSYRNIYAYLTELKDCGYNPALMENILDVGVGLGRLVIHFFPFQAQLYGCDVTASVLEYSKKILGQRVNLQLTQTEPLLPYESNFFDFVYANSVFTHIPCYQQKDWIAEFKRITKPGGCVIATYLDASERFGNYSYVEFHQKFQSPGCRTLNEENGVKMITYVDRPELLNLWSSYFEVLDLRPQYKDQSHLILRKPL